MLCGFMTVTDLSDLPAKVLDTLASCDAMCFLNIHILLCLFTSLFVATATSESSSTLQRLLTYLHNTVRLLVGCAHMTCNRNISVIDTGEVIGELAKKKRRINFVL